MGHHSGRGTTAAAMVHCVLVYDDSYGVFGTSKHTDSYIWNNNQRVKKELQIFAILVAGSKASSSCGRAAYRADQGYRCQFGVTPSCYGGFVVMVGLSFCCSTYYDENARGCVFVRFGTNTRILERALWNIFFKTQCLLYFFSSRCVFVGALARKYTNEQKAFPVDANFAFLHRHAHIPFC